MQATTQVPGTKQADNALSNIAGQGILGSFCVLFIIAVVWGIRGWLKEKDGRLADQKAMSGELKENNESLKNLTIELKEHSSQLVMDSKMSQDAMGNALSRQENALDDFSRTITTLKDEQVHLKSTVGSLKDEQVRLASAITQRA